MVTLARIEITALARVANVAPRLAGRNHHPGALARVRIATPGRVGPALARVGMALSFSRMRCGARGSGSRQRCPPALTWVQRRATRSATRRRTAAGMAQLRSRWIPPRRDGPSIGLGREGSSAPSTGWLVEFAALARVGNASFLANALATEVLFSGERVVCAAAEREVLLRR
jgi:hypothetical protein